MALDFVIYSALMAWRGTSYQFANVAGYATGTATSFIVNARFNFRTADKLLLRFAAFCTVGGLGLLVSAGILYAAIDGLHLNKYLAKALTLPAVVFLQFNLNRLISFRRWNQTYSDRLPESH